MNLKKHIVTSDLWLELRNAERLVPLPVKAAILPWLLPSRDPYDAFNDKHDAIFIHIPKTAGTSIATMLDIKRARHIRLDRYATFDGQRCKRSYKFCFVRNPYDRLLSAYSYLHAAIGKNQSPDVIWAGKMLADFPDFEAFVLRLRDRKFRKAILSYIHFLPQVSWISLSNRPAQMDFIGRFETLDVDAAKICAHFGLDEDLPKTRISTHNEYKSEYSHEMCEIVFSIYRDDFKTFGYEI